MTTIPKGRTLPLSPITQPSDSSKSSKADYRVAKKETGNRANELQQHRNGSRKFFDNPSDRPSINGNGVALTPGLRSE